MKRGDQAKLAANAKISEAFICQILSGKRRPSWMTAKKLAEITHTQPDFWLESTPEKLKSDLETINF